MNSKKLPRKPKHERRDALKHFNYDPVLPVSSFGSSSFSSAYSCSSVYTDLYEGELVISITPRCWQKEVNEEVKSVDEDGLSEKCEDRDSFRVTYEVAKTIVVGSGCGGGISGGFINGICPPMIKLPPKKLVLYRIKIPFT
ncbi:hypothetical protein TSUD_420140 [Trifolium subterraneum]|uniref:Uncharacterized protein n=1 Tax=Trifolium subterraneum TaxID=3900 RepID=A0A1B5Z7U7_TRISU|nr:hypothetical protein TSUD_420140 [Trifolium subterraneum]